jgi:hypothetical protein
MAPTAPGHRLDRAAGSAGLEAADRQGRTCLLEPSDPRDLPFHLCLGYTNEAVVSTPEPPVWILFRTSPRTSTSTAGDALPQTIDKSRVRPGGST